MSVKPAPAGRNRLLICSTVLDPGPSYRFWLDFHLRQADLIMIFMDDPSKRPLFEEAVADRPVMLVAGAGDRRDNAPSVVMRRIMANTQTAVSYAVQKGYDWVAAVDTDELLYDESEGAWRAQEHVGQVTFANQEAVPVDHEPENCFAECTLFRVNGRTDFMAYGNGKSAVRASPGVRAGIHEFHDYVGEHHYAVGPVILHYPNPSFDSWVAKFSNHGVFSNYWWDDPSLPIELQFMLRSRDLVHAAIRSGDWREARAYFRSWIPDAAARARMLAADELRVYSPVTELLRADPDRLRAALLATLAQRAE
ncbi:hypothetical protein [Nocardia goodfellowii]|uniref:Glycosyltransferase family 2 protein n=1 Tax=Nocardia goodfellowii TaxID=882446 RepID=A0ABS4Q6M9_9NOCA|nr:hypothetical protein [Nocardia goodfellowii]MBP2187336.1 hypothetical protein [Nocardia goodfellowii]